MSTNSTTSVMRLRGLRHRDFRLLFWLSEMSCDNHVAVAETILAERCEMSPQQIFGSLKRLSDRFPWFRVRYDTRGKADFIVGMVRFPTVQS